MMNQFKKASLYLLLMMGMGLAAMAQSDWPKEIPYGSGGKITIYQPQPEKLDGVKLSGRAAVSIRKKNWGRTHFWRHLDGCITEYR